MDGVTLYLPWALPVILILLVVWAVWLSKPPEHDGCKDVSAGDVLHELEGWTLAQDFADLARDGSTPYFEGRASARREVLSWIENLRSGGRV